MKIRHAFAVVLLSAAVTIHAQQTGTQQPPSPPPDPAVVTRDAAAAAAVNADAARNAANAAHAAAIAAQSAVEQARRDAAADRRDLIALGATAAILSFLALVFLSFVLFPRKPAKEAPQETELERHLQSLHAKLDTTSALIEAELKKTGDLVADRFVSTPFVTPDHLNPISVSLSELHDRIDGVAENVADIATRPTPPPAPAADSIALERQVLDRCWKAFRANSELSAAFDDAASTTWDPLLRDLVKFVPAELKPTFDTVIAPLREHRIVIHKLGLVPDLIGGNGERSSQDADDLWRTRESVHLLQSLQVGSDVSSRLRFHYKSWVTDTFLQFADLYLQRCQQARLENRHADLQPGETLVRQLLRIAAVEPIDVTPGETAFDSTRHIGRSTTNDPRFADGVITGVVRNGFIEGGQLVIRQPEVVVNRTW